MKQCTKCEQLKSLSEFYKDKSHQDGFRSWCKKCMKKYHEKNKIKIHKQQKEYYQIHKVKILEYQKQFGKTKEGISVNLRKRLKSNYGLTLGQYDKMVENQDGVCAICGSINENGHRLCVDHDHKTGKIRALLCHRCNRLIGWAGEDITVLRSMINYLEKYRTSEPGV